MDIFTVEERFLQVEFPFHSWECRTGYWYCVRVEGEENVPIKGNLQAAAVSNIIACATMSKFMAEDFPVAISNGRGVLKVVSLSDCLADKSGPSGYVWRINRTSSASLQIIIVVTNGELCVLELSGPEFDAKRRSLLSTTASIRRAISHNLISVNDSGVMTHAEVSDGAICIYKNGEIACRVSGSPVFRWVRDFSCVSDNVGVMLAADTNGKRNILTFDLNSGKTIALRPCDSLHPIGVSARCVVFRDQGCILISNTTLESPQIIGQLSISGSMLDELPVNSDLAFASSDDGRFIGVCIQTRSRSPVWITYDLKMDSFFRTGSPTDRILF